MPKELHTFLELPDCLHHVFNGPDSVIVDFYNDGSLVVLAEKNGEEVILESTWPIAEWEHDYMI